MESIRKFVAEFKKRETRLNCLILNAAYHGPKATTKDGFERNIGVNHLGIFIKDYFKLKGLKFEMAFKVGIL